MAENTMGVKIIAPDRVFYENEAEFLEFNTIEGIIGIYPKHIPMTVVVAPGVLKIQEIGGEEKIAALHSGFAEILGDKVTIIAEVVEWPEEIDAHRAEEAKRADRRIKEGAYDMDRAELALKRSMVRLQLSK